MQNKIIEVKTVSKAYKGATDMILALNDIDFNIEVGDIVGYVGQNGAGKSTTIKLLLGLMLPTNGEISVLGNNPFKKRIQNAKQIGTVMGQKSQLWWELPLIDSFKFLQAMYDTKDDAWLAQLIDLLEVNDFLHKPVRELSLGQKMRGELIAALVHQPKLLFLDEATLGLDVQTKNVFLNFLMQLNKTKQTTIIMTTHDLREVERIANKIILIDHGQLKFNGAKSDFIAEFKNMEKVEIYQSAILEVPGLKLYQENQDSNVYVFNIDELTEKQLNKIFLEADIISNVRYSDLDLTDILTLSGI
ncbi:ATP-binding cassette domain-containing protein [Weissella minor]|nr:ATP-binding cassette domain-containing protein [Weissella minor]